MAADSPARDVRRVGRDLLTRYVAAARSVGAVEASGYLGDRSSDAVRFEGRFGAGVLSVALRADSGSGPWSTFVRLDGDEVELEDRRLHWVIRRSLDEVRIPVTQEGDLFGLLPPEGDVRFLGEDADGQRWEYAVRGGAHYRVWLADAPLRLVRRDVIRPNAIPTTFLYREFTAVGRSPVAWPRRVLAEEGGTRILSLAADRLAITSGVPRLRPLDPARRGLFRAGEALFTDSRYASVSRRIAELGDPDEEHLAPRERGLRRDRARLAAGDLGGLLDGLAAAHGAHPLLELQRALLALRCGDALQSGIAIRAAQPLGRLVLPVAARVGVLELEEAGDSALLEWALTAVRPVEPGDLVEAEQELHAIVVEAAYRSRVARGETEAGRALVRTSWGLDPSNQVLASLIVADRLADRDESGAVRAARALATARPADLRSFLFLGDLLEGVGRTADAEALYRAGMETWPLEPAPWLRLGRLLAGEGRHPEAEDVLDELIERNERWDDASTRRADVANEIAWELATQGVSLAKARRMIDYALSVNPEDPYYLDTLGVVHWKLGNRMAAIMAFERALARLDHPTIREHLARARR